jgi:hypothetical protein
MHLESDAKNWILPPWVGGRISPKPPGRCIHRPARSGGFSSDDRDIPRIFRCQLIKKTLSIHGRYLVEDLRSPIADPEQVQPHQVALATKVKGMSGVNTDVVNLWRKHS